MSFADREKHRMSRRDLLRALGAISGLVVLGSSTGCTQNLWTGIQTNQDSVFSSLLGTPSLLQPQTSYQWWKKFGELKRGDIFFVGGSEITHPLECLRLCTYGYWSHSGIILNPETAETIEAYPPKVMRRSLDKYQKPGFTIQIGRVKTVGPIEASKAASIAEKWEKIKFSYYTLKNNEKAFYCSKLVWMAYKKAANIDLDSTGGIYVTPDNIYLHPDVKIWAAWWW